MFSKISIQVYWNTNWRSNSYWNI